MAINFRGYLFKDNGDPVEGATVQLLNTGTTTVKDTFSGGTTSAGLWYFSEADQDKYDVKITSGSSSTRYIRWDDQISVKEVDVRNDTGATTPAATFTNLTNATANQVAVFSGANTTRADGDEIYLSFKLADSAGNIDEFARMTVDAADVTSGEEDGQIRFSVAVDGTLTDVFTINSSESGGTDMTLDVSGDLTLDADGGDILFKDGGTTFGSATNTSGNLIIKSGTTTALTFSGANVTFAGTVDATTDFTIGDTVITNGVITDSTGLQLAANLDIDGTADISGDLTLSGGADGALQFTNAGENSIKIPDNQASALIIEEANNAYITFVTTNSSEAITVAKATTFSAGIANSGTIAAGTWNGTAIATSYIAADAITGAKIADDAIDSEHYTDGSIDTAHLAADVITGAKIADDAIDSEHYTDGSIDTAHLAADVVTGAKIADDAIDSEHYTDGSIDNAHIADDAIDSEHYADGSIDNAHIADDAIDSEHYAAASIDFAHIQNVAANSILGRDANSSGVLSEVALATTQILIGDGTGFTPAALSGDATMTNAGVVSLASAQTNITSVLNASLVVGRDAHNDIDFTTDNTIRFRVGNEDQLTLTDGALTPSSNAIVDLGTDALEFKDAYFDGTLETDALTIGETAILAQATTTGVGAVELATAAEITTATSEALVMTPGLYSDSIYGTRYIQVAVTAPGSDIAEGDNKAIVDIPAGLNGMDLSEVRMMVVTAGNGSTVDVQLAKNGSTDMLTTSLTIDDQGTDSIGATAAVAIKSDGSEAVATGNFIAIDVDGNGGDTTIAKGLIVTMGFRIPT